MMKTRNKDTFFMIFSHRLCNYRLGLGIFAYLFGIDASMRSDPIIS